jgi:hypothetical protein
MYAKYARVFKASTILVALISLGCQKPETKIEKQVAPEVVIDDRRTKEDKQENAQPKTSANGDTQDSSHRENKRPVLKIHSDMLGTVYLLSYRIVAPRSESNLRHFTIVNW